MYATARTFRARDSRSALAAVKAALGPDAVILSTREVEGGLFRSPEIEVTAALEPEARSGPAAGGATASRAPMGSGVPESLQSELETLRTSLKETQAALRLVTEQARAGAELRLPPAAAQLHGGLVLRGMHPRLAENLIKAAVADAPEASRAELVASVRNQLAERVVATRAPWLQPGRRIVALVGPTGVGKTTTLAKIAARALMERRSSVALITVDTYRIGAAEQLARYGHIMRLQTQVARSAAELQMAVARTGDAELVLVDTAGRSALSENLSQAELVRAIPDVELHLVLSAAVGYQESSAIAEKFKRIAPSRVILTRLDEAAGPAGVISALVPIARPVSCITDGQRVPEDLHTVTAAELLERMLGHAGRA